MRRALVALFIPGLILCTRGVDAQGNDDATREASKHFRRGVELYGEANYAGALIEFKRALALSPNVSTLYNVGETQFQLQDYAGALTTFRRFLAEAPAGDAHRSDVERSALVLNARVGRVRIATVPMGAEVAVEDEIVGRTPLSEPVLMSVSHRKIAASLAGHPSVVRYVDVAADDQLSVTLQLPAALDPKPSPETRRASPDATTAPRTSGPSPTLRATAWIGAGVLGAAALTFGALGIAESWELQRERGDYPTTASALSHTASLTTTYSVLADSLAAAGLVAGGVALYWTLSSPTASAPQRGSTPATRIVLGPASANLQATF